jgi:hypothetical protein
MAVSYAQRRSRLDDDDDPDLYDPKYHGQRVIKDGKGVRVPVFLTDAMSPEYRAAMSRRPMLFDASMHRPHQVVVDASDPNVRAAERAYEARNAWLQDAWRQPPSGQMQQSPDNGNGDDGDDDDEPLSPRDQYIARISNGWRAPIGQADFSEADAVQRATMRRQSPGAFAPGDEPAAIQAARKGRRQTGGVTFGQHNPDNFPTQDGYARPTSDAAAERDAAYQGLLKRLTDGWRR